MVNKPEKTEGVCFGPAALSPEQLCMLCTEHPHAVRGRACDPASCVFAHSCLTRERRPTEQAAGGAAKKGAGLFCFCQMRQNGANSI